MNHHTIRASALRKMHSTHIFISILLAFGVLVFAALAAAPQAHAAGGMPCHQISSPTDAVGAQYGSPIDFFGTVPIPFLTVECDPLGGGTVKVRTANPQTYIYKHGFHRVNGAWKRFTFTGAQTVGAWVVQDASAPITDLNEKQGKVIAYVCQKVDGAWKCGCKDKACARPYWQVQTYGTTAPGLAGLGLSNVNNEPGVYQLSTYMALPGAQVTVSGAGFSKTKNDILLDGSVVLSGAPSPFGSSILFTVPETVAPGKYELTVRADGKKLDGSGVLWVQQEGAQKPGVTSISPKHGKQGGTYTITGFGFSKTHNDIITTFGVVDAGPSKDGTTLTFVYNPFGEEVVYRNMDGSVANYVHKISAFVVSDGGTSNEVTFTLDM